MCRNGAKILCTKIQKKLLVNIYFHLLVRQRKKEEDGRGRTRRRGSEADGQDQKSSWFGGSVNHLMIMISCLFGGSVNDDDVWRVSFIR